MSKFDLKILDNIVKNTLESIDKSKDQLTDIKKYADDELRSLYKEYEIAKEEAKTIIQHVDQLEIKLKESKKKLLLVNKEHDKYTESQMKEIYDATDRLRVDLAVEKEKEIHLIRKRNDLEIHIKSVKAIVEKADSVFSNFSMAFDVINGDLKKFEEQINQMQSKEIWSSKIIEALEHERERISRDMHDGPAQSMSHCILKTELCIKLIDKDQDRTRLELHNLKNIIRGTIEETRQLIYDLRPMSIDDLGLLPTIERYVDKISDQSSLNIVIKNELRDDLLFTPVMNVSIYRIIQEALNNAKKYSNAKNVVIWLKNSETKFILIVKDDGDGFDIHSIKLNYEDNRGFGLSTMQERAHLLNGKCRIDAKLNAGTSIIVEFPL